jgi:hypothetical protein
LRERAVSVSAHTTYSVYRDILISDHNTALPRLHFSLIYHLRHDFLAIEAGLLMSWAEWVMVAMWDGQVLRHEDMEELH